MSPGWIVRQVNEKRLLAAVFAAGALSRAELARRLGLMRSTTGSLVRELADEGLVRERAPVPASTGPARAGRPSIAVEIAPDGAFFIGAYIGVDRVTALGIDLAASVRCSITEPFDGADSEPRAAVAKVSGLVERVIDAVGETSRIQGISVALPGFLGPDGTDCHAAILGWHDVNVADLLRGRLGTAVPVGVENDANAFAIAERYRGSTPGGSASRERAPEGIDDGLFVLIESGVGAGILVDGRLLRGRGHGTGEIGHMPIGERGFVPDPERPGRLESYVGKEALLARYRHHGGRTRGLEAFLEALDADRVAARRTATDWAHWLGRGLATLASVIELQRIVVGGSVGAPMLSRTGAAVEATLGAALARGYPVPDVCASTLGPDGAALGAACGLHDRMLTATGEVGAAMGAREVGNA